MYKIIWKPVKYINYIINNGLVLYPGTEKKKKESACRLSAPGGRGTGRHQGAERQGSVVTAFLGEVDLSVF